MYVMQWGEDLHIEHEHYIVHHYNDVPTFVTDFPRDLKPFYARTNQDEQTVSVTLINSIAILPP